MASSSVMSSVLGIYRGCFKGKFPVGQLTSVGSDDLRIARRNMCCFVNRRCILAGRRQGQLRLPLLSLAPLMAVGIHGERTCSKFDSSPLACRAFSTGNPGLAVGEEIKDEEAFVEVGFIANTHGLQGELHVHSLTDFPEERFEKPGVRWLRTRSMGRPSLKQVELVKGRVGPGKRPSWLVTLKNFNTLEKASELIGSTMLVEEDKSPPLGKDEFYIPDLVGMTVVLQESGEEIGVILNVFSVGGGNDLLQVSLVSSTDESEDGRKIWIPFVKEIVPVVDKEMRRIEIDPPEGLLELNAPNKGKDMKNNQQKDMKERRKLRGKLGGLKKRLIAMGQTHILAGLSSGSKDERNALLEQLLSIDFGLLQQALDESLPSSTSSVRSQAIVHPPKPPPAFPKVNWQQFESWMDYSTSSTKNGDSMGDIEDMKRWWRKGLELIADGRVAVVVLAGGQSTRMGQSASPVKGMADLGLPCGKSLFQLQTERLLLVQELASLVVEPEFNPFIPWIIMTSEATDIPTREYLKENNFFGLDESQVWFIKQDSMPCISAQSVQGRHDVLMETPWKIAEAPNGNGGLFSALHGDGIIDQLIEEGIEYVQVYAVDNALVRVADPVFFGYVKDTAADIGVKVVTKASPEEAVGVLCLNRDAGVVGKELEDSTSSMNEKEIRSLHYSVLEYSEMPEELKYAYEESLDPEESQLDTPSHRVSSSMLRERRLQFRAAHICVNIFSVDYLKRLGDSRFEFKFHTALKTIPHVKQEDKEWVEVAPEEPNGMKLELFIFDAFKFCDPGKVALLEVLREEEFAPVKNATGPSVPDTLDTARDLVLALQSRLMSSTFSSEPESPQHHLNKILVVYLGGHVNEDVQKLLDYRKDEL